MLTSPFRSLLESGSQYGETTVNLYTYADVPANIATGKTTSAINSGSDIITDGGIYIGFNVTTLARGATDPDYLQEIFFHELMHSNQTINALRDAAIDGVVSDFQAATCVALDATGQQAVNSAIEHYLIGEFQNSFAQTALGNSEGESPVRAVLVLAVRFPQ